MRKPAVAIVILNWNGKTYLEKFLPSVVSHSSDMAEIIIADNASTDDSLTFLKEKFPDIRIIEMAENTGYTGGYNRALNEVDADYYVLLNSDIEVTAGWLEPIIGLMESDKSIAACQPKILDYNCKNKFEYAGAGGGFIDFLGYPFCRGRIFNNIEDDNGQYDDTIETFWASGACMFVRAKSFHEAGGFDDDFFAHMEEIDLCWRLKRMGHKIMYCGKSTIYHVGGGTLPKSNPRKTYYNFRNNLFLLSKNLKMPKLLFVLLLRVELDRLASVLFLLQGNFKDFKAVIRAWGGFITGYKRMRLKNRHKEYKRVSKIYRRSIVFSAYLQKKKSFNRLDKDLFS